MKKFLLTSLAVMFAVISFAQFKATNQVATPVNETRPVSRELNRQPVAKNVKAPQSKNVFAQNTLRRAAIESIDDLQGEFIVCNNEFSYDSEAGQLVSAPVSRKGISATIEVTSENTIAIYGIDGNATTAAITATVDVENSTISIAPGQIVWTYVDGETQEKTDFLMTNSESETGTDPITGTIYEGGIIVLDQIWHESYLEEGVSYRNGYYKGTTIATANGIMEYYSEYDEGNVSQNVLITQDEETKVVTIWNVHNFFPGMVMDVNVYADKTFDVPGGKQVVYMHSSLNEVYLWGSPKAGSIDDIKGTVVEDVALVSTTGFGYVNASLRGWVLPNDRFTITLTDGNKFTYPATETGELVTLPDGLTPVEYPFSFSVYVGNELQNMTSKAKVAKSENDYYFQGLDIQIPEAWVKGTYDSEKGTITIPVTYTGAYEGTPHFFAGYGGSNGPKAPMLDYDADADTYSCAATIMIYKGSKTTAYSYYYNGLFLGTKPAPTTAPDGLVTTDMPFKGKYLTENAAEAEEVAGTVKVGRDGNDLYIQNLFATEIPGGWLKGTFTTSEGKQYVKFPMNQYVGDLSNALSAYLTGYMSSGDGAGGSVSDVYFVYDEGNDFYTAVTPVILTRFKSTTNYTSFYQAGLTIGNAPTAISNIKDVKNDDNAWYNLNGVRVAQPTQKGLYIHNGKKFVIK